MVFYGNLCPLCQAPVMSEVEFSQAVSAGDATYHTLRDVPKEAFPLFLSSKTWYVKAASLRFLPCHPHLSIQYQKRLFNS